MADTDVSAEPQNASTQEPTPMAHPGGRHVRVRRPSTGTLPIVVGFVGHRDPRPEDLPGIKSIIAKLFAELRSEYPHTPLIILSPLAEGADRIGAEVALESGAQLVVPLPFDPALYEQDFEKPGSQEEFQRLLDAASHWFVLPLLPGFTLDDIREHGEPRDMHYAQVGAYVSRSSQILVALWDGSPPKLLGGTADVVGFRLRGIPNLYSTNHSRLDPVECGPVLQVVTPTLSRPMPTDEPLSITKHFPEHKQGDKGSAEKYNRILSRIELFNRDDATIGRHLEQQRRTSREYVWPNDATDVLPQGAEELLDQYSRADTLAGHYQKLTIRSLGWIFALVFLAVFFFEIYAHVFYNEHWLLALYLISLAAAFVFYRRAHTGDYQTRYLDYRALAEGLRVQFFWAVAGINDSAAAQYLRKQRTVLDWIRNALRTWNISTGEVPAPATAEQRRMRQQLVIKHWVDDQAAYFSRAAKGHHGKLHRMERWVDGFFFLAIGVAVVQLALRGGHGVNLGVGVLLVMAGLLHGYLQKRAFAQLSKQYERMAVTFDAASKELHEEFEQGNSESIDELLHELGIEALSENGDWVLLHRERPIEVPRGA